MWTNICANVSCFSRKRAFVVANWSITRTRTNRDLKNGKLLFLYKSCQTLVAVVVVDVVVAVVVVDTVVAAAAAVVVVDAVHEVVVVVVDVVVDVVQTFVTTEEF